MNTAHEGGGDIIDLLALSSLISWKEGIWHGANGRRQRRVQGNMLETRAQRVVGSTYSPASRTTWARIGRTRVPGGGERAVWGRAEATTLAAHQMRDQIATTLPTEVPRGQNSFIKSRDDGPGYSRTTTTGRRLLLYTRVTIRYDGGCSPAS